MPDRGSGSDQKEGKGSLGSWVPGCGLRPAGDVPRTSAPLCQLLEETTSLLTFPFLQSSEQAHGPGDVQRTSSGSLKPSSNLPVLSPLTSSRHQEQDPVLGSTHIAGM